MDVLARRPCCRRRPLAAVPQRRHASQLSISHIRRRRAGCSDRQVQQAHLDSMHAQGGHMLPTFGLMALLGPSIISRSCPGEAQPAALYPVMHGDSDVPVTLEGFSCLSSPGVRSCPQCAARVKAAGSRDVESGVCMPATSAASGVSGMLLAGKSSACVPCSNILARPKAPRRDLPATLAPHLAHRCSIVSAPIIPHFTHCALRSLVNVCQALGRRLAV